LSFPKFNNLNQKEGVLHYKKEVKIVRI